jgi:ubiquinone/menaquinone biosynthesis C-methylase UbiE
MEHMWRDLSRYYDLIYSNKPYQIESDRVVKLVRRYKKSRGKELLDVACGTGGHLEYLKRSFHVTGCDVSNTMLKIARGKLPGVKLFSQDMRSLHLGKQYDILICLFSAIAYTKTYPQLRKVISSFSRHLKTGGVLIIEPFLSIQDLKTGFFDGTYVDRPEIKLCRLQSSKLRGNVLTMDFHFLIATSKGVKYVHDPHHVACFAKDRVLALMETAGLNARYTKRGLMPGRGLYIGIKK